MHYTVPSSGIARTLCSFLIKGDILFLGIHVVWYTFQCAEKSTTMLNVVIKNVSGSFMHYVMIMHGIHC